MPPGATWLSARISGRQTEAAVIQVQELVGITPDGIVGSRQRQH